MHSIGGGESKGVENQSKQHLREVLLRLFNAVFDPQQKGSLPLVQLTELVKLEEFIGKAFLITRFYSLEQVNEELVLPGRSKGGVDLAVGLESSSGLDQILDTMD